MEMADEQVYSQTSACQSVFTTVTETEKHEDKKRGRTESSIFLEPRSIPNAKRSMPYFSPDAEHLSSEQKVSTMKKRSGTKCELKAIICMKVDPRINTKENLNFHFSKFGVLTHIKCDPLKNYAYIKFKTHAGAAKAKKKGSVFSDDVTPMKLYWTEKNLESKRKSSNSPLVKDFVIPQNLEKPVINEKDKDKITTEEDFSQQVIKTVEISRETLKKDRSEKMESIKRSSEAEKLIEKLQMPAHTIEEKLSRLEDRDKLLHMAETNEFEDNLGQKMKGTCFDMCPEKERYMRKVTFNLSVLETSMTSNSLPPNEEGFDHRYVVKEYSRSSADQQKPLPHELRPPRVLLNTMNYLVCAIMNLKGDPFLSLEEWYNFLWNRTRSIRKDIAQQQLCDPTCVEIMEKCTRFHILCIGELWNQPLSTFEPKINNENLTKSLQTLKHMYADLRSNGIKCPNEAEFRGYDILLSLSEGESLRLIKDLKSEIRKSAEVKFALNTALALTSRNYIRFFKLMESATYLKRCILMRFLNKVRIEAIQVIIRAFCPPNRSMMYPTLDLMQNLGFQSSLETIEFCEALGLNATQESVRLHKKSLNVRDVPQKIIKSSFLIRDETKSIAHIVCNDTVPENPIESYEPSVIFDEDGYLLNIVSRPTDHINKVWKYAGLSVVDGSTSPIPLDLLGIDYPVDASTSPIPEDLLEIDCKPMQFTVGLENASTFDEIKSEEFNKSSNENECIDMIDVEFEADHKNTSPEIYLDMHDGNLQNVLQEITSQNVLTPEFLDVSEHFSNKPIFSSDMHNQYIFINTEANETKPNETSFPPNKLQINKNIFLPDNIRNEVPNELDIFDQRIETVLHPVGITKSDMKSELNKSNVDKPIDVKYAFHSDEFITKQEMFKNTSMGTFESKTTSEECFKPTKPHTPAECVLRDVSDQLTVKNLLFDALSQKPSKEKRTVISSNLHYVGSNNLTSLIRKDEDLPDECEEKEKIENSLQRQSTFLVKDKENLIFADDLKFVIDQNKTLLEENDTSQIEMHLENKNIMLAQKVIYKWVKYCSKRKVERTLNNSLPVHPLLGLHCHHLGHEPAVSPIAIMRNSSVCKTTDYDKIFSHLFPSNCIDFLPTFRTLRVFSNKNDAPYLKGTSIDKFWKLLLVLPEEKSDELLMVIMKWIIAKFSAQKIKRCEDGSYMLSCFQLPICSKKTVICVRALVVNETSAKAIKNSSALVCGMSAMLVVFPKSFQDEHNLNDFYELLECFLYRVCLKTAAISPICILLLDSINKFDASEKINCFLQKCRNVTLVKVTSFVSNLEMNANLLVLNQVIAWLIKNEVKYPEIEVLSLIKYVENASSFAINYMHRELSYANIDLSTVLPNHIINFFNKVIQYQASVLNSSYIKRLICSPQELHFIEPSFKFSFNENFQDTANKFMESMILPLNDGDINTINVWDFIADVAASSGCDFSKLAFIIQCHLAEVISNTGQTFPLSDVILTCALYIFNHKSTEAGIDMNSSVYWLKEEMNSTYYEELWENCMHEYYSSSYRNAHTTKCRSDSPEISFNRSIVYSLTNKKCENLDKSARSLLLELSKKTSNAAKCNWSTSQLVQFQSADRFSSADCNTFHTHEIKLQCSQVLDDILHEKEESDKFLKKLEDAVNFKN